jgi:hypothetical protein
MLSRHTKWTSCCDRIAIRKDLANPRRIPPWPLPHSPLKELRPLLLLPSSSYLLQVSNAEGTSCKGSSFFSKRKTIKPFFFCGLFTNCNWRLPEKLERESCPEKCHTNTRQSPGLLLYGTDNHKTVQTTRHSANRIPNTSEDS